MLSETDVRKILAAQGTASAQAVGQLFDVGAETIRRIWRRETHRNVQFIPVTDQATQESLDRLLNLSQGENTHDPA